MSENKKNVPKRRFKEFENDGAWEQSEIGENGYFYYGKSAPKWSVTKDAKTPCVRYGELYTKHAEKIDKIYSYTNIPRENLKFSIGKEVLVPRVGEDPLDFANCSWLSISDVAIGEMISVYNTEQNPLFTAYMFNALFKHEFAKRVEGGNVSNLYYAYLEDIPVSFPNIDEQVKISTYLDNITKIITLHQRKLEKMKALKKAYLTEMFPSEGERKPNLRFDGFTDDWEQRELGDVTSYIKGFAFKSVDYKADGIRIIRVSDLSKDCVSEYVDKIYIDKNRTKQYINYTINNGDIVITTVGSKAELKESAVGRPIIFTENKGYLLNQNLVKIAPILNYDSQFIYNQLLSERYIKYIADIQRGNANQANITISDLWEYSLQCPPFAEQKKIGQFFTTLDNLITLHQRKLEKLQNIKKAYLNEMFI